MHDFSYDWKPRKKSNLEIKEVEEDLIIYDPSKDAIFLLNKTAKIVLEMCDGNFSVKEMADIISQTLNLDKKEILEDLKKSLNELRKKNIVE